MRNLITKRNLIIVVIIGLIVLGLYALNRVAPIDIIDQIGNNDDQPKDTQDYSNLPRISQPAIEKPFEASIGEIEIDVKITRFTAPLNLPLYELKESPFTDNDVQKLATSLEFKGTPTKSKDYSGSTIYSYYESSSPESTKVLDVIAEQRTINYASGTLPDKTISFAPTKEVVGQKITSFLKDKGLLANTDNLEVTTVQLTTLTPEGHSQSNQSSNAINVSLAQKIENLPLLASSNANGSVRAVLNSNLDIISLELDSSPEITKGDSYPLKDIQEISESLSDATIQDIGGGLYDVTNVYRNSIGHITITSYSLAYLKEAKPGQKLLQPIYVLKGPAYFTNGGTATATLYLPAFSKSSFGE